MQKPPIYLKAVTLKNISEVSEIKKDAKKEMIIILRVTPLAHKDVEQLRKAIDDLYKYVQSSGGDIARLGEERVVITPPSVKIWKGMNSI
ncbi:MAG: cell division protein SepF [Thermoproteota archaeon]|nr:cell division protein SepF [Thermoproteota archaeon]